MHVFERVFLIYLAVSSLGSLVLRASKIGTEIPPKTYKFTWGNWWVYATSTAIFLFWTVYVWGRLSW